MRILRTKSRNYQSDLKQAVFGVDSAPEASRPSCSNWMQRIQIRLRCGNLNAGKTVTVGGGCNARYTSPQGTGNFK